MKFTRYTTAFILILCCTASIALAQVEVRLNGPISIAPQQQLEIPIQGTLTQSGITEIEFTYPNSIVRIVGVRGEQGAGFQCTQPLILRNDALGAGLAALTLSCNQAVPVQNGTICYITVEGVRSTTPSGVFAPVVVKENGTTVENPTLIGTTLQQPEQSVLLDENSTTGLVGNYPNPMSASTTFVFVMSRAGIPVHLSVHTLEGVLVQDLGTIPSTIGENSYQYTPDKNMLADGRYLMRMVAEDAEGWRRVSFHTFVVIK